MGPRREVRVQPKAAIRLPRRFDEGEHDPFAPWQRRPVSQTYVVRAPLCPLHEFQGTRPTVWTCGRLLLRQRGTHGRPASERQLLESTTKHLGIGILNANVRATQ